MRISIFLPAMAISLALTTGCGNPDERAPAEATDSTASPDTADTVIDTTAAALVAVELPGDFPTDFPIAPASTVLSASSVPDAGGAYNEVSIASQGDPRESYQWYRQALTDAGWQISSEGQTDETRTLHATQGESYVDLTVMPHPDRSAGWVRVDASIWKAGT